MPARNGLPTMFSFFPTSLPNFLSPYFRYRSPFDSQLDISLPQYLKSCGFAHLLILTYLGSALAITSEPATSGRATLEHSFIVSF
jgi:hypothetical protein